MLWLTCGQDTTNFRGVHLGSVVFSAVLSGLVLHTTTATERPAWLSLVTGFGFAISVFWLSVTAYEVVAILKSLAVIENIPEAVLGYTVFAVGNSLDDLVADLTVTHHGHTVMVFSACLGGPPLDILLGLRISGLYVTLLKQVPVRLEASVELMVMVCMIVGTLVLLLALMWLQTWHMARRVGCGLIVI